VHRICLAVVQNDSENELTIVALSPNVEQ